MTHKGQPECVCIAISQPDGNVAIMQFVTLDDPGFVREPTPENIEAEIIKSNISWTGWRIIDPADVPQDRTFRNAWKDDGSKVIHDMEEAAFCPGTRGQVR